MRKTILSGMLGLALVGTVSAMNFEDKADKGRTSRKETAREEYYHPQEYDEECEFDEYDELAFENDNEEYEFNKYDELAFENYERFDQKASRINKVQKRKKCVQDFHHLNEEARPKFQDQEAIRGIILRRMKEIRNSLSSDDVQKFEMLLSLLEGAAEFRTTQINLFQTSRKYGSLEKIKSMVKKAFAKILESSTDMKFSLPIINKIIDNAKYESVSDNYRCEVILDPVINVDDFPTYLRKISRQGLNEIPVYTSTDVKNGMLSILEEKLFAHPDSEYELVNIKKHESKTGFETWRSSICNKFLNPTKFAQNFKLTIRGKPSRALFFYLLCEASSALEIMYRMVNKTADPHSRGILTAYFCEAALRKMDPGLITIFGREIALEYLMYFFETKVIKSVLQNEEFLRKVRQKVVEKSLSEELTAIQRFEHVSRESAERQLIEEYIMNFFESNVLGKTSKNGRFLRNARQESVEHIFGDEETVEDEAGERNEEAEEDEEAEGKTAREKGNEERKQKAEMQDAIVREQLLIRLSPRLKGNEWMKQPCFPDEIDPFLKGICRDFSKINKLSKLMRWDDVRCDVVEYPLYCIQRHKDISVPDESYYSKAIASVALCNAIDSKLPVDTALMQLSSSGVKSELSAKDLRKFIELSDGKGPKSTKTGH